MIEPRTATIQQLAERWNWKPEQIIEVAIDGEIGLYFRLGNCVIADLPNPNPGHRLQMRHYQGYLRADKATLESVLNDGEARHVQEAYLPGGTRVFVELPPQEVVPTVGGVAMRMRIQMATPLTIKIDDLYALRDEVRTHGRTPPAPEPEPQAAAPAPVADSASSATETKEQRQDRRLQACIDAGLAMDAKAALLRLPDGVGKVAGCEGVTRQAFSSDVKAALKRRESSKREGAIVHRA